MALAREGLRLRVVAATWLLVSLLGPDPVVAGVLSLGVWGFVFGWRTRTAVVVSLFILALALVLLLAGLPTAGERAAEGAFYVFAIGLAWALPVFRSRHEWELLPRRQADAADGEVDAAERATVRGRASVLGRLALAAGLYAAATLIWLFPTVSHLTTSVLGTSSTSIVTVWELWANEQEDAWPWNREESRKLIGAPEGIQSPARQLSLTPFTVLPQITLKTLGQHFGWVAALNLYTVLGFVGAALAMFLLLERLGVGFGAALFGGYVWGFSPHQFEHALGRLELVPSLVLPLLLWSLLGFHSRRSLRSALVSAALLAVCWYTSLSFALLATWMIIVFASVDMLQRRPDRQLKDVAFTYYALAAASVLMLVPAAVAWAYSPPGGAAPSQSSRSSASLWQYLLPSARHPLLGEPSASYERRHELAAAEPSLFFGYVTIVLAVSALVLWRRRGAPSSRERFVLAVAAVLALSSLILSLLPAARLAGTTAIPTLRNPLPDTAEVMPAFASFGLVVGLGLVILAACALSRVPERLRAVVAVAALALTIFELASGAPVSAQRTAGVAPETRWLARQPPGIVVNYPFRASTSEPADSRDLFQQIRHGHPLFEGAPPGTGSGNIRQVASRPGYRLTAPILAAFDVRYAVVHLGRYGHSPLRGIRRAPGTFREVARFPRARVYRVVAERPTHFAILADGFDSPELSPQPPYGDRWQWMGSRASVYVRREAEPSEIFLSGVALAPDRSRSLDVLGSDGRVLGSWRILRHHTAFRIPLTVPRGWSMLRLRLRPAPPVSERPLGALFSPVTVQPRS